MATISDAVYHEIGHILAAYECFPDDRNVVNKLTIYKKDGRYGGFIKTNFSIKDTPTHNLAYILLSGGIFQQMMNLYLQSGNKDFQYFCNNVDIDFDIMSSDLLTLSENIKGRTDLNPRVFDGMKKVIIRMIPYLEDEKVTALYSFLMTKVTEALQTRNRITIGKLAILKYLKPHLRT